MKTVKTPSPCAWGRLTLAATTPACCLARRCAWRCLTFSSLHNPWGWLFLLATPLLVKQARYVMRERDPVAMRPMLERTVKGALLTNLLFVIGIICSRLVG